MSEYMTNDEIKDYFENIWRKGSNAALQTEIVNGRPLIGKTVSRCNSDGFLFWIKGINQEHKFKGDSPAEIEEKEKGEVYQWSSRAKELERKLYESNVEDKKLNDTVMTIFKKRKQNLIGYIKSCSNSPTSSTPKNRPDGNPGPHDILEPEPEPDGTTPVGKMKKSRKSHKKKKSHKTKRKSHKKKRKSPKKKRSRKLKKKR